MAPRAPNETKVYGIREVYRPLDKDPDVDIVAVHGLNGDALKSWTTKDNDVCWLYHPEFLPKYLPNARVLVWGYNASTSSLTGNTPSKDRIHQHAQTLVAQLYADRKLERRVEKPIIFLCHSLGGIIVKRALAYSHSRSSDKISHIRTIFTCTYGILFFGTPHHGSSKASLLLTLQKLLSLKGLPIPSSEQEPYLVAALEQESETLQNISDFFVPLMKHFCIYFFWEQQQTKLKFTAGKMRDYVVSRESAAPLFDDTERAGIEANHSGMVKFGDPRAQGFRIVAAALDKYCEEAPEAIRRRWEEAVHAEGEERKREAMEKLRRIQTIMATPLSLSDIGAMAIENSNFEEERRDV